MPHKRRLRSAFNSAPVILRRAPLEPGESPTRLFKVLYPLASVTVDVIERQAEDFDELELIVLRLIAAGVHELQWLAQLLGISARHTEQFVDLLIGYSHIERESSNTYRVTELGKMSVEAGRRITRTTARQTLLCDGISGQPLPKELYAAMHKLVDEVTYADDSYAAVPIPSLEFDETNLDKIMADPKRNYVNVVDEIQGFGKIHDVELRFLPGWLMEYGRPGERPKYRFFSNVNLPFEQVPEEVISSILKRPLPEEKSVEEALDRLRYVESHEWRSPEPGLIVKVNPDAPDDVLGRILQFVGRDAQSARPQPPIKELEGHGILTYLWTDSEELLHRAGVRQALMDLRDLERDRRLTREVIPRVCRSVSERIGVIVEPSVLHEDLRSSDSPRLQQLLGEL